MGVRPQLCLSHLYLCVAVSAGPRGAPQQNRAFTLTEQLRSSVNTTSGARSGLTVLSLGVAYSSRGVVIVFRIWERTVLAW